MYFRDIVKNRILITGANGKLGQRTVSFYKNFKSFELLTITIEDEPVIDGLDYLQCDITDRENVKKVVFDYCPDFIINTAAYTNVDKSETDREAAWKVNVKAVEYLSESARVLDAHIIHISSDYLFDGKSGPYSENAVPNPLGYYGRTKLASENALRLSGCYYTIVRTNVLYCNATDSSPDFVKWVINSLKDGEKIKIVTDQINNPTFVDDLVQGINKIIEFGKTGVYNIGGREFISRYDFTMLIADYFHLSKSLVGKIITEQLKQPARRPLKSGLITLKAETELGYHPHTILEALAEMREGLAL
ncbi:MAG: dTDP-4-dehydrorhamnose reductase [Bacteroidetes bacterium]|nr:dTDP-4-dehydrorhamnose reductase [Bacteroidota bacterium]